MSAPETNISQNTNNLTKNDNEGLPDIAESNHNHFILLAIIGISIFAVILVWWFHRTPTVVKTAATDETFSVSNDAPSLTLPPLTIEQKQRVVQAFANANNPTSSQSINDDAQKAILMRLQAPMIVVGQNNSNIGTNLNLENATNLPNASSNNNTSLTNDSNNNYLNQVSNDTVETVNASVLHNRSSLIAQGNLIHAILETAVNSDLPGFLRAIVSEPVYSEDGSQVLIAPGSRLIGQYKSGILAGQDRIFTVWTRIIEPNGISIQIGSPGVDNLGDSGQGADDIDYHFWQMFRTATLLSILSASASNVDDNSGDEDNASQQYRQALSQSLAQSSSNSLQQYGNIPPTLHINQGTPIMVFVAKDLRFGEAMKQSEQAINIF